MSEGKENYQDKYLEEKFKGLATLININHETILDKIKTVDQKVTKTNGSVARHEDRITILERNYDKCPVHSMKKDIKKIEEETDTARFFYRNPKLIKPLLIGSVFLSTASLALILLQISNIL